MKKAGRDTGLFLFSVRIPALDPDEYSLADNGCLCGLYL
jgi:hypothetical protein